MKGEVPVQYFVNGRIVQSFKKKKAHSERHVIRKLLKRTNCISIERM